mgnify:CR=1 FL=1
MCDWLRLEKFQFGFFGIGPDDVIYSASKLHFAFGLGNSLYFPAYAGATSVLVPERVDAQRAFEVITGERPTIFFTVPTLYARMLHVEDAAERVDGQWILFHRPMTSYGGQTAAARKSAALHC